MVYLVTDGSYSDYRLLGVYSTPAKAAEAKEFFAAENDVEVFEIDAIPDTNIPPGYFKFHVLMTTDGETLSPSRYPNDRDYDFDWQPQFSSKWVSFFVVARDEAGAIKIANERRIMLKASGELHADWIRWRNEQRAKAEGE